MVQLRATLSALLILHALARRNRTIISLAPPTIKDDDNNDIKKPKHWDEYTRNGTRYWQTWKDRSGPDVGYPITVGNIFETAIVRSTAFVPGLAESLELAHLSTDAFEYDDYAYVWPKFDPNPHYSDQGGQDPDQGGPCPHEQETALFECMINAKNGTFIAENIVRGGDLPKHIKYSSVAWHMWVTQIRRTYGGQASDFSGLSTYWMANVGNDETLELLDYIFHDLDQGHYLFHPYGIEPATENPFWALLGSVNGRPIIFMLTDFKNAMRGKGISGIWVDAYKDHRSDEYQYNMWADIELMDPVPD